MKTTLDLPDEVLRAVKVRAEEENKRLEVVIADLLRRALAQESGRPATARRRSRLPLIECAHEARPEKEMSPDSVADVLLDEEARLCRDSL